MAEQDRTADRCEKLLPLIRKANTMLIVVQDNPDPDAIAAAVGLREWAHHFGDTQCSIVHGGTMGRAENRALVEYLNINLRAYAKVDPDDFDLIAIVDAQPGTGNHCLPAEVIPDIVIDHHPIRATTRKAKFTDVRSRYGATSTILWQYLRRHEITPEVPLATALMYGIQSDTQDLGRKAVKADIQAVEDLYPLANKRMLSQIRRGRVPGNYYQLLVNALARAQVQGRAIIAKLGEVDNPDMMGETADLFLRHEEVDWTLAYGLHEDKMLFSVRTTSADKRADKVAGRIANRLGTSGGHETFSGGQIPLSKRSAKYLSELEEKVRNRFLKAIGAPAEKARPLVVVEEV